MSNNTWQTPHKSLAAIFLIVALGGCQRDDLGFDDYVSRLERVLDTERQPAALVLPDKPHRHQFQPLAENRYGLFESFSLKPCGVMNLIGEHNNQLGKTAPPSQQLIYHHQLAQQLLHCDDAKLDAAAIELKSTVLTEKQARLPSYSARLMLISDEIWHNLDASAAADYQSNSQVEQALTTLAKLKQQLSDPQQPIVNSSAHLEQALKILHHHRQPRQLHRAMVIATDGLNQAISILESVGSNLCGSDEFKIMNNILHRIYATRLQPRLAQIQRLDRQLTPQLQQLLSPWPAQHYFNFYLSDAKGSLRQQFYQAIGDHQQQWQRLLSNCDVGPNGKNFAIR
ncbi:DUF3080 family protein [Ferrimonas senticii]|uniref:DUF3080 family protein n=1 Tax=Ferrimonas senticii TaxID=394566 RepID=UPI000485C501|nr:DUF3080 family protein [Ferrimonas senticii]